jgi:hypothetical protein
MGEADLASAIGRPAVAVDMAAPAFVLALIRAIPPVQMVRFVSYAVTPSLSSRVSALGAAVNQDTIAHEALVHDTAERLAYELPSADLDEQRIDSLAADLGPDFALALTSLVTLSDRSSGHIPMLDLKCDTSLEAQRSVVELFRRIGSPHGALLDSGQSYHYYGFEVVTESEWRVFLGKCLLSALLVDTRYIAHRLIDGFCSLRINATVTKPKVPTVVACW